MAVRVAAGSTALFAAQVARAAYRRLPSFDGLDLSGSFGDPDLPRLRVLVLGDSTVTAPGLTEPDHAWPRLVARHLADRYRVELTSLAEGGARSADVLERQVPLAEEGRWDLTVVSVGSNDVLHFVPVWRFASNMDEIVVRLQRRSETVVLFGVGDLGSIPRLPFPVDRLASMSGHVADWVHIRTAARHGIPKVDQWTLTTAAFNSGIHMFSPDLFHPSPLGHRAWADALIPTVERALDGAWQASGGRGA